MCPRGEKTKVLWQNPEYRKLMVDVHKGRKPSLETISKIVASRKRYRHSQETKDKISKTRLLRHCYPTSPLKKGHKIRNTGRTRFKKGFIPWNKEKHHYRIAGCNHYNWQGGITPLFMGLRTDVLSKNWRIAIFQRDNHTCQKCGNKKSNNLNAHHIKSFKIILKEFLHQYSQFSPIDDKETLLRLAVTYEPFWDINNGMTLCKECHSKITKGGELYEISN